MEPISSSARSHGAKAFGMHHHQGSNLLQPLHRACRLQRGLLHGQQGVDQRATWQEVVVLEVDIECSRQFLAGKPTQDGPATHPGRCCWSRDQKQWWR